LRKGIDFSLDATKGRRMNLGLPELLIVLVIVLLLFGARKLPDLARSLGRSTKEFKQGMKEGATDEDVTPLHEPRESGSTGRIA
jgi:sec-independent protein translocase protein TatA